MTLRHVRRAGGLVMASAALVVLAGCGSSTKSTPAASATTGTANIQAYVSCLNQHGVTIALPSRAPGAPGARPSGAPRPRPSRSPGAGRGTGGGSAGGGFGGGGFGGGIFNDANNPPTGVSQSAWTAALTACKSLQPTFTRGGTGTNGGFNSSQFTAYRNCLQSHGVTASGGTGGAAGMNTADPKTAAALKTCAPLRPTGRPTGAPSTSG